MPLWSGPLGPRGNTHNAALAAIQGGGVLPDVPLPSLPLAAGAKFAEFGHSFAARGYNSASASGVLTGSTSYMRGAYSWIKFFDQRFNVDFWPSANLQSWDSVAGGTALNGAALGLSGDRLTFVQTTAPGLLYRMPYLRSNGPDIVGIVIGTNDIEDLVNTQGMSASDAATTILANYDQLLTSIFKAGIWAIPYTIISRGTWPLSGAADNCRLLVNAQLKAWKDANRPGLYAVADGEAIFGPANAQVTTNFFSDLIHPSPRGMYAFVTTVLLPILQGMVSAGTYYVTDPADAGNLHPDKGMLGTSGTKSGAAPTPTGNVANNYNVNRATGTSVITCSKEVIDSNYEKQVIAIAPASDGTKVHAIRLQRITNLTLASMGIAAGDWLIFRQYVEMSAWDQWVQASATFQLSAGSSTNTMSSFIMRPDVTTGADILPSGGFAGWFISDPIQVPAGTDTFRASQSANTLSLMWNSDGGGNGVVKLSKLGVQKVAAPYTAWKLAA